MEVFIFEPFCHGDPHLQGLLTSDEQKDFMFQSCWSSDMLP
jgi:hypothetical protein